jgi:hypothetical protein
MHGSRAQHRPAQWCGREIAAFTVGRSADTSTPDKRYASVVSTIRAAFNQSDDKHIWPETMKLTHVNGEISTF